MKATLYGKDGTLLRVTEVVRPEPEVLIMGPRVFTWHDAGPGSATYREVTCAIVPPEYIPTEQF